MGRRIYSSETKCPYLIEGPVDIYDTAVMKIDTDNRPRSSVPVRSFIEQAFLRRHHSKIGFSSGRKAINRKAPNNIGGIQCCAVLSSPNADRAAGASCLTRRSVNLRQVS